MKKLNLFLMMFASLTLLFATSCGKNVTPPPIVPDITLAVSGGTDVTVVGGDITKDITVMASQAAVQDITITLSSPAIASGDASFASPTITIKQGETSAVGKITFPLAKFPKGTDAKKITVSIATSTENVKVDVTSTDFSVKGEDGKDLPKLTIAANGTEFNTTEEAKTISLTFTLTTALQEELPITLTLGSETSENIKAMFPQIPQIKIAAGETTFTLPFDMPKGTAGKIVVNFAIDNKDVVLETTTLSAIFKVDTPPTISLCATSENSADYAQLSGFTIGDKTVTIASSDPAYQDKLAETIANVNEGDPIKIGVMSNDGDQSVYCHAWVDWNNDNKVDANEMVGTTQTKKKVLAAAPDAEFLAFAFTAPAGTPSGEYHMRVGTNYKEGLSGCANPSADESRSTYDLTIKYTTGGSVEPGEDPTFSVETTQTGDVIVPTTGDKEITFKVKLSGAAEEEQTITLAATSTGKNGTIDPTSVVFAVGETSKDVKIKFLSSDFTSDAVSATVTVTATSQNLEATSGKGSIAFKVKGTAATSQKQDLKLYIYSPADVFFTPGVNEIRVGISVAGQAQATATSDIVITPTITGGVLGTDYKLADGNNLTIKSGAKSGYFYITLLRAGAGKAINVDFNSDLVTFYYEGETATDVYSSTYTQPGAPADLKVTHEIPATAKAGTWLYPNFTITAGEQEAPIFITYSAKDADGADVTGQVRFPSQPIVLSDGEARGDLQFNSALAGKVVTITFTSFDTTFATGKNTVTVTVTKD